MTSNIIRREVFSCERRNYKKQNNFLFLITKQDLNYFEIQCLEKSLERTFTLQD